MSRIGKIPVKIPQGAQAVVAGGEITVTGPKGALNCKIPENVITVAVDEKNTLVLLTPASDSKMIKSQWGLYRVLINNMMVGVTAGFTKVLEIEGVGYKAEVKGRDLSISVGYSKPVLYEPREGIALATDGPVRIVVSGIDKQAVGQTAAEIRSIRPPEPYKGKGIRYKGEHIIRKAGKTGIK